VVGPTLRGTGTAYTTPSPQKYAYFEARERSLDAVDVESFFVLTFSARKPGDATDSK
jgi:hypothetical protein